MGEAVLCGQQKGGFDINGIIEKYRANGNVNANDFVEFVKVASGGTTSTTAPTVISNVSDSGYTNTFDACKLDENRVFVAYTNSSSQRIYGLTVTMSDDGTMIISNPFEVTTSSYGKIRVFALGADKILMVYCYSSSYYLYGFVFTISNDSLGSYGTATQIASTGDGYWFDVDELVKGEKYFIANGDEYTEGSCYLYSRVITISGTTITAGTAKALVSSGYCGVNISVTALSSDKVLVAHQYSSSRYASAIACSINGTTITTGTRETLESSSGTGYYLSAKAISDSKAIVCYSGGSSYTWNAIVCTISGTTLTLGAPTTISSKSYYCRYDMSIELLPNGNLMVIHSIGQDQLSCRVLSVSGTTISTVADEVTISTQANSGQGSDVVFLNNGIYFILHGATNDYRLHGQYFTMSENTIANTVSTLIYETQVQKITTSQFDGIAKTSGTDGTEIEIYTL